MDILLSGATGVIGEAIAKRLTSHTLHFIGRKAPALPGHFIPTNLADPDAAAEATAHFVTRAAQPFAMVCAAGDFGVGGNFADVSLSAWRDSFALNFFSPVSMVHAFTRGLRERGISSGRIILLSGGGVGSSRSFAGASSYSTNKASLTHFAEAVAPELAAQGITINAVAPGAVLSRLTDTIAAAGGRYGKEAEALKTNGKAVSPELAAHLVQSLLADAAQGVTGRLLSARFDREAVENTPAAIANNPDLYRQRRIDEQLFGKK